MAVRLCRFRHSGKVQIGIYDESFVIPMSALAAAGQEIAGSTGFPETDCLLTYLPHGSAHAAAAKLADWAGGEGASAVSQAKLATEKVELLVPIPRPNKLFMLAGNYAKHIEEGGEIARERAETFPYVFMKPPSTTLTDPAKAIRIPSISPNHIDWELELAIVIGREAKGVSESDALDYVAGFTIVNDISNRKFKPNPQRIERPKDGFFDWLHGKWHDSFCACGPCVTSADAIADPQSLDMKLAVNDQIKQDASTAQQIFPVAAVIEFVSSFVTLEPGDILSTGTPAGVGNATGDYLKAGDFIRASIDLIGTLETPVDAE